MNTIYWLILSSIIALALASLFTTRTVRLLQDRIKKIEEKLDEHGII
jgi:hypothetical protein